MLLNKYGRLKYTRVATGEGNTEILMLKFLESNLPGIPGQTQDLDRF